VRLPKSKAVYVFAASALALLGGAGTVYGATYKTVTVQDSGQRKVLHGFSTGTVGQFLERYNIHVNKRDRVSPALSSSVKNHQIVNIVHPKRIYLDNRGKERDIWTFDHDVDKLLEQQGIALTKYDHMNVDTNSSLSNGEKIEIHRIMRKIATKTQKIPFQTIRRQSDGLLKGHEQVATHGVEGLLQVQTTSVYRDGKKTSQTVKKKVVRKPVDELVEVGAKPVPVVHQYTLSSRSSSPSAGVVQSAMTVLATAYTAGGITASGRPAQPGVVAVDPSVIPLGTRLYIPGIGDVIAADTGGAIIGRHIDICMSSESAAAAWGERTITVYILH
jgi:uncharacterized protein YabE (DUF348 family)